MPSLGPSAIERALSRSHAATMRLRVLGKLATRAAGTWSYGALSPHADHGCGAEYQSSRRTIRRTEAATTRCSAVVAASQKQHVLPARLNVGDGQDIARASGADVQSGRDAASSEHCTPPPVPGRGPWLRLVGVRCHMASRAQPRIWRRWRHRALRARIGAHDHDIPWL